MEFDMTGYVRLSIIWMITFLGLLSLGTAPSAAGGIQMLPPTSFDGQTCTSATGGLLQWDGETPIKCVPGTSGDGNGNINSKADITTTGNINAGKDVTAAGNVSAIGTPSPGGSLDIENGQNNANLCLNGKCTSTAFNPATCHIVTNEGIAPYYVSDARCATGEFVLSGGGMAETPGSGLCGGTSQGFIHYDAPDADLMGWTVDAYGYNAQNDVCTEAFAVCCSR